ncbi:MAG: ribosome-associated translation inhibitor RaiA [Bacteroidota bacterium]
MKVEVQSVHFSADQKLLDFINDKVGKLEQFHDSIIGAEVFLRLDKEHAFENKIAELKIQVPGKSLFAKKQCQSFEEATDLVVEAIRKQVNKHKEKS